MDSDFEKACIFNELSSERAEGLMNSVFYCITKDSETSQFWRKRGNQLYYKRNCDKRYEEIHEYYSRSIAYAPIDSDDLALAYGNRSALLHRIKKYKESILDIDKALEINKSDNPVRVKLVSRKMECLEALDSNKSQKIPEHMLILQKKEMQNPFESVAVKYNEHAGRHLIASRDIRPGEIIFVEKPYVGCCNNFKGYLYCGHCFTKTWSSIPCDFCNWCMFCSKNCKLLAWLNYHDTECSVISTLLNTERYSDYPYILSLRSLFMGVKESGSITNFLADIKSVDEWIDQLKKKENLNKLFKNGIILSKGFESVYSLCNHEPPTVTSLSRVDILNTIRILIFLCKYSQFFGESIKFKETKDLQENKDVLLIGSIFLKLWRRSHLTFHSVHDVDSSCKCSYGSINCSIPNCTKGACIPSLTYFISHSCSPNVKKCITDDYKVIVYSLLPIKKNSQLFIAYQQSYFEIEKSVRQKLLCERFKNNQFVCSCEACMLDWPTINELWKMPTANPELYIRNYNKQESELYDENDKLVKPIIINCQKVVYNQKKVRKIANSIEKAATCLQQPSVVMCELMICLCKTFKQLYCSKSS